MPRTYRVGPRNIPSQDPSKRVPYFPDRQADEEQFVELRKPIPHGYAPGGAFVVSGYDSRPINSQEFTKGLTLREGSGIDSTRQIANGEFVVPRGRTLVLREWGTEIYWQILGASANDPIVTFTGQPNALVQIDFLINGSVIANSSGIETLALCFGPTSGDTFIIIPQGQTLGMRLTHIPFVNSFIDIAHRMALVNMTLQGQLLLSTGQTPDFEIGNKDPIPVVSDLTELRRRGLVR